ncbi:MAG: NAD(P)/FAD-dependent oxidoreductase [Actinomycetota bacterium]
MENFDLAIVGAGIIGASCAYCVSQCKPEWRLAVIDRSFAGDGATRYSVALDLPFGRTPRQKALAATSVRFYQKLKSSDSQWPIRDISFAVVASAASIESVAAAFVETQFHVADNKERIYLQSFYPGLNLPHDCVVLVNAEARYFMPQCLTRALLRRACATGRAQFLEGTEIADIHKHNGELTLLASDGREISARRAVLATGPWITGGPGGLSIREEGIRTKKVVAMHIESPPKPNAPVLYFAEEDSFLFPHPEENRFMLSIASAEWDCPPEISELRTTSADRLLATSILERYCPDLMRHCSGSRVFCDAYSPDRAPLIARMSALDGVVAAGACSGSGMRLAPAIAMEALRLLDTSTEKEIKA